MDDADRALITIEQMASVSARNKRPEPSKASTGECWYCGDNLTSGLRWCDAQCRDDWAAENKQ